MLETYFIRYSNNCRICYITQKIEKVRYIKRLFMQNPMKVDYNDLLGIVLAMHHLNPLNLMS